VAEEKAWQIIMLAVFLDVYISKRFDFSVSMLELKV